jgi:type IV fimbrial biogenesis protein FimT
MHIPAQRQQGVTLVELLVTMSILVILLTVGVSGMTTMVKRNARATEVNAMVGHLNYARAQAVLRATTVRVCAVDTSDLAAGCSGGTEAWADGYAVIVEDDGDVLRVEAGTASITMKSTVTAFRFRDDGTGTAGHIKFCDVEDDAANDSSRSSNVVQPRQVIISGMGRVRISEKTSDNEDIDCS